ncbi:uncharacterized protein MYCGRDRAFT_97867 [Zymoseptoria tritici IPO323]|uniref:Uncharacterized protein n=1 Tax=Zymoseptoria tritici (strain CBS 115943 / IPO323) TaxID=336722 RepID=F9XRM2_ZYMTI|nr:uncharacterized protein MYCGRDRAFT_97867 [Zymoseptoria tritici IPO323]EGP82058.1 hypothetical protein MYCGRDRAFT_97867 [Zymoseptoria tritici IPO323]
MVGFQCSNGFVTFPPCVDAPAGHGDLGGQYSNLAPSSVVIAMSTQSTVEATTSTNNVWRGERQRVQLAGLFSVIVGPNVATILLVGWLADAWDRPGLKGRQHASASKHSKLKNWISQTEGWKEILQVVTAHPFYMYLSSSPLLLHVICGGLASHRDERAFEISSFGHGPERAARAKNIADFPSFTAHLIRRCNSR